MKKLLLRNVPWIINSTLSEMKIVNGLIIAVAVLGLTACSASKKVPYVVDADKIPQDVLSQVPTASDPILSQGDLLNIEVTSTDMQSVVPFNNGMYVTETGHISKVNGQTSQFSNNYEASTEYYLINQDGTIYFPIIGKMQAAGKTKLQLTEEIANAIYPKYVKERPKVEIRLMNFRVIVTGAVKTPGVYQSRNERMNFFEALAMAGDLDIKGDRENILLYRANHDGTREVYKLNIHDKNFLLSPYFNLQQNDVIYVAPNKSMAANAWQLNPGVSATLTFVGTFSSLASLIVGIINLTKN